GWSMVTPVAWATAKTARRSRAIPVDSCPTCSKNDRSASWGEHSQAIRKQFDCHFRDIVFSQAEKLAVDMNLQRFRSANGDMPAARLPDQRVIGRQGPGRKPRQERQRAGARNRSGMHHVE